MKTIKRGDQIKRAKDEDAENMVRQGWNYCPKSDWKKTRAKETYNVIDRERESLTIADNLSDKKKRKTRKEIKKRKYQA